MGDMVVSMERARAQGKEYGHGTKRELVIGSPLGLNLMGYDHMDDGPQRPDAAREGAI
jgi:probable rRNA maturation factor